jgi:hypothetical protein
MITVKLTSDRGWIPGGLHDWKPQERVLVVLESPGLAGVIMFSGTASDVSAAQAIQRAVSAHLNAGRAGR